jgi:GT2 family glycosyltransferase/glycosyltransferase involved in cell wall biosynthesis
MNMRHIVCVMGMHRSGTSLLMRSANLLGVDLGDREKLLPPGEDNPAGYWENQDILKVNNALLEHFGGSWDRPPHFPVGWEHHDDLAELRVQALKALASFPDNAEVIGWKDPRLSLLLPFWRSITSIDQTVVAIRHPASVAASLQYRNGFTIQHAASLWLRYTLEALVNAPDTIVLSYGDMLADSTGSAQSLAEHLRLPTPKSPTVEQIRDFVQPELSHQTEQLAPDSPTLRIASELFEEITANPNGWDLGKFQALVASWNEAAQPVGGAVTDLRARLEEQRQETRRTGQQFNHQRNQNGQLRSKLQETEKLLEVERENAEHLREYQQQKEDSDRALARERERSRELGLAKEFEHARGRRLEFELAEAEHRASDIRQLERESEQLRSQLSDAEQRHTELRSRISVRLALPIAEIVRRLLVVLRWLRQQSQRVLATDSEKESSEEYGRDVDSRDQEPQKDVQGGGTVDSPLPKQTSANIDVARGKEKLHETARTEALIGELCAATPVSIVVPVYNAVDDLHRCVDSVRRNTTFPSEILLIDDASPDPRVAEYLDSLEGVKGVRVLRNAKNLGFGGTVNRGIRESEGDVVVLNSDTEVTPRWLTNLALAAHEDPTIGSATPLSDNAGAFSIPERGKRNDIPIHLTREEVGRLVTRTSQRSRPDTPTASGFCMYLKRAMLDTVELFDEESFPRGYGEENDFCMRARRAGWRHIVDDATLVFHEGSISFGEEKQALLEAGLAKVAELHPDYQSLVHPFLHGPEMQAVRETARAAYENAPPHCLPRILHVIHKGTGGVHVFNDDLARGLADRYEHFQLVSDADSLILRRYDNGKWVNVEHLGLESSVSVLDHHHDEYRHEVARILEDFDIEVVHVQHLIYHSHDLPLVADAMGLTVVATLHDYLPICPTIQLIDDQGRFCGGTCTPGQGKCRTGMPWVRKDVPHLKHAWVHEWKRRLTEVLAVTDALVAPTEAVRQTYLRAYPEFPAERIKRIEHGVDMPSRESEFTPQGIDEPIRILALGNINDQKGAKVLDSVLSLDADRGALDLHILGAITPNYQSLGRQHGTYTRERLPALIDEINPRLVVLLSPWGETFCYTLTEAWACGVPVVAADVGALGERVRAEGGGWVVNPHDPESVYETILQAGRDSETYREATAAAHAHRPRSVAEMADDYDDLYRETLAERGIPLQLAASTKSIPSQEDIR